MKRTSNGRADGRSLLVCEFRRWRRIRRFRRRRVGGGGSAAADDGADYLCLCGDGDDF